MAYKEEVMPRKPPKYDASEFLKWYTARYPQLDKSREGYYQISRCVQDAREYGWVTLERLDATLIHLGRPDLLGVFTQNTAPAS